MRQARTNTVDGLVGYRNRPDVIKKLSGHELFSGRVYPLTHDELEQFKDHGINYLLQTSRVIGTGVEGMANSFFQVVAPSRAHSLEVEIRGEEVSLVGDTEAGPIRMDVGLGLRLAGDERLRAEMERLGESRLTPVNDLTQIFNACSTTLFAKKPRLILPRDNLISIPRHFWLKLIFIGLNQMKDLDPAAVIEFGQSPNGTLLRLRRIAEKLSPVVQEEPAKVVSDLIDSAIFEARMQQDVRWFTSRLSTEEDRDFVRTMVYFMLAREGVDAQSFLVDVARTLAEGQFRADYRQPGVQVFEPKGITQLMYEMFLVGRTKVEKALNPSDLEFNMAQYYASVFQFLKEMEEVVSRRDGFLQFLKTGSFPQ
ncbi:MAG TPA: hypothetical protein VI912_04705 [Candidatus Bilamarchaeaceae archaeon]|nr:hypothetical protein [Candidatus Bilamarchaeaceae archaeon]